jgi:creatinine amidohydrolase
MADSVFAEELTPRGLRERIAAAPIAYLPLGTLEWHGEHLPLGADGLQPRGFFELLAREVGGVVLPMLFVGPDIHEVRDGAELIGMDLFGFRDSVPRQLDGSAYWVPDELFEQLLAHVLRQLARVGFRVVVAHGHGPSTTLFLKHTERWEREFDLRLFTCRDSEADPRGEGFQCDHAAANETSLMMALRPELVEMENLDPDPEVKPMAVDGEDPRTGASAERGQEIIRSQRVRMSGILRRALSEIQGAP